MDRVKDQKQFQAFSTLLSSLGTQALPTPGIADQAAVGALAAQLVDSVRRIEYLSYLAGEPALVASYTPYSGAFEPLRGASSLAHEGRSDEAYWLTYLVTHFGKHRIDRWNLLEDVYGALGSQGMIWNWEAAVAHPAALEAWFNDNEPALRQGRRRRFSNHRKYETLKPGPNGAGAALRSYVEWIGQYGSHAAMIAAIQGRVGQNPQSVFGEIYKELGQVSRLGRLGKFDLLCNLSNLKIAPIFPDKAYIAGSSGPLEGAKLLFGKALGRQALEAASLEMAEKLDVSPQAIEDSLCNWQKSPTKYKYFRG